MPTASIKKIIPCNKKDLVTMILDIEKYPEFVPWCLSGKIHRKDDKPDMIEMEADLTVGKKFLNQTYTSHVTYYKDKGKILVSNIGGPLKHLENKWEIREINNQSEVHFKIDFEISEQEILMMGLRLNKGINLNKLQHRNFLFDYESYFSEFFSK